MSRINKTRYAILGVLSISQKPGSGYDIKKACDRGISFFWNENFGHIYPVLRQMEQDGVITKTVEENPGRPQRHVYSVTAKGHDELIAWLLRPVEHTPQRLELPLKLTFAKMIPAETTLKELERVMAEHQKSLAEFRQIEEQFIADEKNRRDQGYPYWLSTLQYGIYDAEFRIKWCQETIDRIKAYQGDPESTFHVKPED